MSNLLHMSAIKIINSKYWMFLNLHNERKTMSRSLLHFTSQWKFLYPQQNFYISAAEFFCITHTLQKVCILTDSKSTVQKLLSYKSTDYYFRTKGIIIKLLLLPEETTRVTFQWIYKCPANHTANIPGQIIFLIRNEIADALAKEASKLNPIPMERTSLSPAIKYKKNISTETWIQ